MVFYVFTTRKNYSPNASIAHRLAVGPQPGCKVFTLQTLPASDDAFEGGAGRVAGFSLHAGVVARAGEQQKLDRLSRSKSFSRCGEPPVTHPEQ